MRIGRLWPQPVVKSMGRLSVDDKRKVEQAMRDTQLIDLADKLVSELSGRQRQ